jgi:integrase
MARPTKKARKIVSPAVDEAPAEQPDDGSSKPAKRKKRRGPKHPGVTLIAANPGARVGHRARYKDPDTGRAVWVTLDPKKLTTLEQRQDWAVRKSRELAKRRMDLDAGAARATGTSLADAVQRYFDAHGHLREKTRKIYRGATDKLEAWAPVARVRSADDLTRAKLLAFREMLIREPKRAPVNKGKRGQRVASNEPRSPAAVNQELRAVRTVLGYVHDLDLLPKLSFDDLRRGLKRLPASSERVEFLKPNECQELLDAALRHDAETFVETRGEHSGKGREQLGSTHRYDPIAPFIAFLLLSGCRVGEALALGWESVDLEARDHEGRPAGEIHLKGAATKTGKARTIGLEVSPALRSMLAAMRPENATGSIFGYTQDAISAAAHRLRGDVVSKETQPGKKPRKNRVKYDYGAPKSFTWQTLRRTCGTYLTNAPGIFGAASAYRSAKQLGHSVQIAEKHYVDVIRGIPREARTLEAAMQIEAQMDQLLARLVADKRAEPNAAE